MTTRRSNSQYRLYATGTVLVLVVLGTAALWKRNNFVSIEPIDSFVCSGTIDDEPLLAELNFAKRPCRTGLIVFPDGTQLLVPGHRIEGDEHVWDVVDINCKLQGVLRGEWDASTRQLEGYYRSIASSGGEKAKVKLTYVAQVVQVTQVFGLKIGRYGERYVTTTTLPRFNTSSELAVVSDKWLTILSTHSDLRSRLDAMKGLFTVRDRDERQFKRDQHVIAMDASAATFRINWQELLGGSESWALLSSWTSTGGRFEEVVEEWESVLYRSAFVGSVGSEREVSLRSLAERRCQFDGNDFPMSDWGEGDFVPKSASYGFEKRGLRVFVCKPRIAEIVIPWSELRPLIKPNGPAAKYLKP